MTFLFICYLYDVHKMNTCQADCGLASLYCGVVQCFSDFYAYWHAIIYFSILQHTK
jgi:hypothetical protein